MSSERTLTVVAFALSSILGSIAENATAASDGQALSCSQNSAQTSPASGLENHLDDSQRAANRAAGLDLVADLKKAKDECLQGFTRADSKITSDLKSMGHSFLELDAKTLEAVNDPGTFARKLADGSQKLLQEVKAMSPEKREALLDLLYAPRPDLLPSLAELYGKAKSWVDREVEEADTRSEATCKIMTHVIFNAAITFGPARLAKSSASVARAPQFLFATDDIDRLRKAQNLLGREIVLESAEARALVQAHRVGANELGLNGQLAGIGNYTQAQIAQKARILKEGGFSILDRRRLMEAGIVGSAPQVLTAAGATAANQSPAKQLRAEAIKSNPEVVAAQAEADALRAAYNEKYNLFEYLGGHSKLPGKDVPRGLMDYTEARVSDAYYDLQAAENSWKEALKKVEKVTRSAEKQWKRGPSRASASAAQSPGRTSIDAKKLKAETIQQDAGVVAARQKVEELDSQIRERTFWFHHEGNAAIADRVKNQPSLLLDRAESQAMDEYYDLRSMKAKLKEAQTELKKAEKVAEKSWKQGSTAAGNSESKSIGTLAKWKQSRAETRAAKAAVIEQNPAVLQAREKLKTLESQVNHREFWFGYEGKGAIAMRAKDQPWQLLDSAESEALNEMYALNAMKRELAQARAELDRALEAAKKTVTSRK